MQEQPMSSFFDFDFWSKYPHAILINLLLNNIEVIWFISLFPNIKKLQRKCIWQEDLTRLGGFFSSLLERPNLKIVQKRAMSTCFFTLFSRYISDIVTALMRWSYKCTIRTNRKWWIFIQLVSKSILRRTLP